MHQFIIANYRLYTTCIHFSRLVNKLHCTMFAKKTRMSSVMRNYEYSKTKVQNSCTITATVALVFATLLLSKSEISSLCPFSVAIQSGFCRIWSVIMNTGFLTMQLILGHGLLHSVATKIEHDSFATT